jgi:cytochrome c peroxidase
MYSNACPARSRAALWTMMTAAGLLMAACGGGDDPDVVLTQQLEAAAPAGAGTAYFVLPDAGDFAAIPQDPRNRLSSHKVVLGSFLFHETALSSMAKHEEGMYTYSCATCHHAAAGFQAGRRQGIGDGGVGFGSKGEARERNPMYPEPDVDVQQIRSPSALNIAYQTNVLWNGQFGASGVNVGTEAQWTPGTPKENNTLGYEGVETQAIAGLTVHRLKMDADTAQRLGYKAWFDSAFADVPEASRYTAETAGLAIAAYERTLLANEAPFQRWLRGEAGALTLRQKQGAILFFGAAGCAACHTGPALDSMTFHALGMNDLVGEGVIAGSAAAPEHKGRGGFTLRDEDLYKFKTPQLYNLRDVQALGHGASFQSVEAVVRYKNAAVPQNPNVPATQLAREFVPLGLDDDRIAALVDFVSNALYDPRLARYAPDALPSGMCFPNNDPASRAPGRC